MPGQTSSKSGYARDIRPDLMTDDEKQGITVPPHTERRASQIPQKSAPVVTAEEAMRNMQKRIRGEMPPIGAQQMSAPAKRGPGRPRKNPAEIIPAPVTTTPADAFSGRPAGKTESYDPFGGEPDPDSGAEVALQLPETQPAPQQDAPVVMNTPRYEHIPAPARMRITLGLQDGDMSLVAKDVIVSRYGVVVLLPTAGDSMIFTPKPGTEITITKGEQSWPCYFPGVTFPLDMLGCLGLVFIRKEDESG